MLVFVTSFLAVYACFRRLCSRYGEISIFLHCFTCTAFDFCIFVFLSYFGKRTTAVYYCKAKMFICCRIMLGLMEIYAVECFRVFVLSTYLYSFKT